MENYAIIIISTLHSKGDVKMYAAMISLTLTVLMFIFSFVFKVAGKLRLTVPVVYYILIKTVFYQFERDYKLISDLILYALVGLVLLSWIISFVKKKLHERFVEEDVKWQLDKAREMGIKLTSVRFDENGSLLHPETGKPIIYHD
jgi:hypothetical protein